MNLTHYQPHLVKANKIKEVRIPFMGLYGSHLAEQFDRLLELAMDEMGFSGEQAGQVFDYVYDQMNWEKYNQMLVSEYATWFASEIVEAYHLQGLSITEPTYIPLNGQNVGDYLVAKIDVTQLPTMSHELWLLTADFAEDNFTSCQGFISFYDPNIEPLRGVDYTLWNDAYISPLLMAMASDLDFVCGIDGIEYDLENAFIDYLTCIGAIDDFVDIALQKATESPLDLGF